MFCPVCKYEFRRGFTHCNQCDVDLVDALPAEEEVDHAPPPTTTQMDHPTLLWSGANGGIFSALTVALDDAQIPYNKEELDARLVFTSQHGDLEVWVPAANLPQAKPLLDSILANPLNSGAAQNHPVVNDEVSSETGDEEELPDESAEGADDIRNEDVARELYPEDATAEVWSGADEGIAEILKSCLAEIGVACYVHRPDSESDGDSSSAQNSNDKSSHENAGKFAVRVLPEDEARARKIVQQVTTGAPPD
jgi:hypothetical protein